MTYIPYTQERLEREIRVAELNPKETLRKVGLKEGDVFCDLGAGSGVFTIPAAEMTKATAYALELNDEMIEIINEKARNKGLTNIKTAKVATDLYPIPSQSCDLVLLSTVLREVEARDMLIKEMRRILKCAQSKLVIIEVHKRPTEIGPPVERRLSEEEVILMLEDEGFTLESNMTLGDNYYCLTFLRS